jgi:filamentous hemagglutinin family protein
MEVHADQERMMRDNSKKQKFQTWRSGGGKRFRPLQRNAAAVAVAACFGAGVVNLAHANPTNPLVVNGAAKFTTTGNLLSITNTPNAIINWSSFSIGANEITRFVQQSASSAVLNRVVGQNPSSILGALQSNGRVFLINPNGIVFGAGSQINVGGLVASTLNLSNEDFLAGRMRFTQGLGNGVINSGNITTSSGGNVYLIGNAVTNNGIITSPKGEVILAAGNSVELVNPGTPDLRVQIVAPDNQALNLGQIAADSGRIGIYAGLINQSGTINANSVVVGENGQITLKATRNTTLEAGSITTANGPSGGKIEIQSGDTTLVAGTVEAKGLLPLSKSTSSPLLGEGQQSASPPLLGEGQQSTSPPLQGEGQGGGGVIRN